MQARRHVFSSSSSSSVRLPRRRLVTTATPRSSPVPPHAPPPPVPRDSDIVFSYLDPRRVRTVHGVALVAASSKEEEETRRLRRVSPGGLLITHRFMSGEFTAVLPEGVTWNREREAERLDSIRRSERSKRVNRKWGPSLLPGPSRRLHRHDAPSSSSSSTESSSLGGRVVVVAFECPRQASALARWAETTPILVTEKEEGKKYFAPVEMSIEDAVYVSGLMRLSLMVVKSARCSLPAPEDPSAASVVVVEAAFLRS